MNAFVAPPPRRAQGESRLVAIWPRPLLKRRDVVSGFLAFGLFMAFTAGCTSPPSTIPTAPTLPATPILPGPSVDTSPSPAPTVSAPDRGFEISPLARWTPIGFLAAEWAPDSGRLLYSSTDVFGDGDSTALVDVQSGNDVWRSSESAAEFAFSPDGTVLAAADGQLRFWDPESGELVSSGYESNGEARLAFFPDGSLLVGETWLFAEDVAATEIGIWNSSSATLDRFVELEGYLTDLAMNRAGDRLLLTLSQIPGIETQREVALWDAIAMKEICAVPGETAVFTPEGEVFAVTQAELVSLFDVVRCDTIRSFSVAGRIDHIAFTPDGHTVGVVGSPAGHAWFYNLATGDLIRDVETGNDLPIDALAFSPDGKYLFLLNPGVISVWEVGTGD